MLKTLRPLRTWLSYGRTMRRLVWILMQERARKKEKAELKYQKLLLS